MPAIAWIASFGLCTLGDVMLGRWVLLPLFVTGFYGGTIIIALVTYPMLSFMARLAQATGSYGMVPRRDRRVLGRDDGLY